MMPSHKKNKEGFIGIVWIKQGRFVANGSKNTGPTALLSK